ncbi:monooxygenase [Mycolicibacterium mucogenicum]|uniref:Monooxygenase n=1 Tax=Mycolicibacterium mucogenicum TaxID=56689 RepID=A0A1A3HEF1_MYCMU|nr:nitronate monooxygenase family protein [Mycolicibacterium mucogenicum]OBJ46455.1 monooxygenase [Mycolicibacterium mucogenicum]
MHTPICDQLGIEFPIVAFSHCRDVVAAVTNAGGLGILGAGTHSPEHLEVELSWIDEHVKGRPYGVDLLLPAKYEGATEGGLDREAIAHRLPAEHVAFVARLMQRYDIPQLPDDADRFGRLDMSPVSPLGYEPLLDVAFAHPIRLIASALGAPPASVVQRAEQADRCVVAALAGTVEHAQLHVEQGAQLIVAQGTEAGGHTGDIATMVLVPDIVDAVGPVPVLAAGGIATGRQLAAAIALGAQGAWCGSVWLTTDESETEPVVREKFLKATSRDTVRSRSITGKPARMLRSDWTSEWDSASAPRTLPVPLQSALIAEAQMRITHAGTHPGAVKLANYFVGQVVGRLNRTRTCQQVILDMVTEYTEVVERFVDLSEAE